jgi:hypothetical protein
MASSELQAVAIVNRDFAQNLLRLIEKESELRDISWLRAKASKAQRTITALAQRRQSKARNLLTVAEQFGPVYEQRALLILGGCYYALFDDEPWHSYEFSQIRSHTKFTHNLASRPENEDVFGHNLVAILSKSDVSTFSQFVYNGFNVEVVDSELLFEQSLLF